MTDTRSAPDRRTASRLNAVWGMLSTHPLLAALAMLAIGLAILTALGHSAHRAHRRTIANQAPRAAGARSVAVPHAPAISVSPSITSSSTVRLNRSTPVRAGRTAPRRAPKAERSLVPPQAQVAARRFLQTYVPFTYAQLPVNRIQAAAPELQAHIAANPPDVPPKIHRLHPRIMVFAIVPAQIVDAGAGWAATSEVADGLESYRVAFKLGQLHGRWLVIALLPGR